jgi:hypothetical protein
MKKKVLVIGGIVTAFVLAGERVLASRAFTVLATSGRRSCAAWALAAAWASA